MRYKAVIFLFLCSMSFAAVKPTKPVLLRMPVIPQTPVAAPTSGAYLNSDGSPLIPLILSTHQTLDIEIYTMEDPYVRALLRDALSRNVKIRILHDPNPFDATCDVFGAPSSSLNCADQQKLIADVQAAGGSYVPFNKKALCPNGGGSDGSGCYEHGKIAISDGTTALLSTGNFDPTNMCIAAEHPSQCDRDFTLIETDSTIVKTLENIYEMDFKGVAYDISSMIPEALQGSLIVSPVSLQPLIDLIHSATKSIEIETQYLKQPQINAALIEMAQKPGISVQVTVASLSFFSAPSKGEAAIATRTYAAFDQAGISTVMFDHQDKINGHNGYLHAKVIIIDGVKAWVGSENGSTESLTQNREYGVVFTDPTWISQIEPVLAADHASTDNETWQQSLAGLKD